MSQDVPNDPSPADDNPFQPHRAHGANPDEWLNSAAVYVRMSTEHQQYSTSNQMDVIREYAKKRGQEIVKEYSDDGKSGLNIKGRGSLEQMIRDVLEGKAHYKSILVYDVSRWGRFQDADESAYYEYICKQAGVWFTTARNNLKMTAARSPPSSRASSGRWRANTAGNFRRRFIKGRAGW
jgi:hypothetical protein